MQENRDSIEIDLKRLVQVLLNKAWIIVLVGILCAALLLSYTYFFVTPQYSANIKLYVNNTYGSNNPGFSASQLQAAQSLANTYMVILRSRSVLNEVAQTTGLPYTHKELEKMISTASVEDTEVFQVSVVCENNVHAAAIANAVADILPSKIAATVDGSSVRVVDYAVPSESRTSPSYTKTAVLGMLVGMLLSAALFVVLELCNDSIFTEDYLARAYSDIPLLAVVPDAQPVKSARYKYYRSSYYRANQRKGGKEQ